MTVLERLNEYLHSTKKSTPQLADELGVSVGGLRDVLKGRNQPSAKILLPLSIHGLSLDWLFTGEGEMTRIKVSPNIDPSKNFPKNDISIFLKLIEEKDKRIEEKDKVIEVKDKLIAEKERVIQLLEKSQQAQH